MVKEVSHAMQLKLKVAASPFQAIFDSLLKLATIVCATDYATISLKDSYSHLFISTIVIEGMKKVPLADSFFKENNNNLLEIEDAQADNRYRDNPNVKGEPAIRFYAGVPITMPLGEQMGTICVFGKTPKLLNTHQKQALIGISKTVLDTIIAQEFALKQLVNLAEDKSIKENHLI